MRCFDQGIAQAMCFAIVNLGNCTRSHLKFKFWGAFGTRVGAAAAEAAEAAAAAAAEEEVGRAAQPVLRRGGEPTQPSTPGTPASAFEYTGDFTGGLSALTNPGPDPDPDL